MNVATIDTSLSIHLSAFCPHQSVLEYLPAGGPPVFVFPRCLNRKMLKDTTDSSRDQGCYRYSETDAHTDRCHRGHLQVLGSGAVDRCVIIIAILPLLIRASLSPGTHPFLSLIPLSFPSPHPICEGDKLWCWLKSARGSGGRIPRGWCTDNNELVRQKTNKKKGTKIRNGKR